MYTLKATGYVAMVTDKEGYATTVDASAESITEEHPLGKEEGLLIAAALVAKDEREAENRRKQKEIEDKKLQEQEQQKSLESNSGFSTVNEDDVNLINKVRKPPQNTLQKYKIRPIGG
jgi:tRNA G46 methylase TrmB